MFVNVCVRVCLPKTLTGEGYDVRSNFLAEYNSIPSTQPVAIPWLKSPV